jgi:hypothetical protein
MVSLRCISPTVVCSYFVLIGDEVKLLLQNEADSALGQYPLGSED